MDVVRHQRHFLDDFLLVEELVEGALQVLVELLEFAGPVLRAGLRLRRRSASAAYLSSTCRSRRADVLDQPAQVPQVVVAALDFLVHDDAVKALLGRLGNQFFGQGDVFLAGEAEAVDDAFDLVFGVFDAFGDLDLLLARQQAAPGPFA